MGLNIHKREHQNSIKVKKKRRRRIFLDCVAGQFVNVCEVVMSLLVRRVFQCWVRWKISWGKRNKK